MAVSVSNLLKKLSQVGIRLPASTTEANIVERLDTGLTAILAARAQEKSKGSPWERPNQVTLSTRPQPATPQERFFEAQAKRLTAAADEFSRNVGLPGRGQADAETPAAQAADAMARAAGLPARQVN